MAMLILLAGRFDKQCLETASATDVDRIDAALRAFGVASVEKYSRKTC